MNKVKKYLMIQDIILAFFFQLVCTFLGDFMIININIFDFQTFLNYLLYMVIAVICLLIGFFFYPLIRYWELTLERISWHIILFIINLILLFFPYSHILIAFPPLVFCLFLNHKKKEDSDDDYDIFKYKIGIYFWLLFFIIILINIIFRFDTIILIYLFVK